MSKGVIFCGVLALALCLTRPVYAGSEQGAAAAARGDQATPLQQLQPLAERGDAQAQCKLGWMYAKGQGVAKDVKEASKWYRLAARQGDARAQFELGWQYFRGDFGGSNFKEAAKWWRLAAARGNGPSQAMLGWLYWTDYGDSTGQGGEPPDAQEAVKWYRLAARQGYSVAQVALGEMYYNGNGVPQSYKEAVRWWRLAAERGYGKAYGLLGVMYELGLGVPENRVLAYALYTAAAQSGDASKAAKDVRDEAMRSRRQIAKTLGRTDLVEGQDLARQLMQPGNFGKALDAWLAKRTRASAENPTPLPALAQNAKSDLNPYDQEVNARLIAELARFDDGTQHFQERVFFEKFKRAVAQGDFPAVAEMMRYPIPVDLYGKKLRFCSKRNFLAHKNEIFTPKTIAAIKSMHYSDMNRFPPEQPPGIDAGDMHINFVDFCRDDSCKEEYYLVYQLRLEGSSKTVDDAVVYRCETPKHTILIEADANKGGYTYRSWNKPKSTTDTPDLVLTGGSFEYFGTGICRYSKYSFKKGNLQINVQDGFGCGDDDYFAKIPPNTDGELMVLVGDKVRDHYYCAISCSK